MFAVTVAAALNGTAAYQIHRATKQFRQFLLHLRPVQQRRMCVRSQCGQQVHVTLRPKIIPQRRAK